MALSKEPAAAGGPGRGPGLSASTAAGGHGCAAAAAHCQSEPTQSRTVPGQPQTRDWPRPGTAGDAGASASDSARSCGPT